MFAGRHIGYAAFALAALQPAVTFGDDSSAPGRKVYELRCTGCHQSTASSAQKAGPSLIGIIGRKAGTADSGVHSRAAVESGTVWTRSSLRRYLSDPGREMPGTLMSARVVDPKELDDLLDYLQTLR
jgi:cytochrome c